MKKPVKKRSTPSEPESLVAKKRSLNSESSTTNTPPPKDKNVLRDWNRRTKEISSDSEGSSKKRESEKTHNNMWKSRKNAPENRSRLKIITLPRKKELKKSKKESKRENNKFKYYKIDVSTIV